MRPQGCADEATQFHLWKTVDRPEADASSTIGHSERSLGIGIPAVHIARRLVSSRRILSVGVSFVSSEWESLDLTFLALHRRHPFRDLEWDTLDEDCI